jgi:hypothetical protein
MNEARAISVAKKMSLDYGEMAIIYRKMDGNFGACLYNDYSGEDGFVVSKYVGGKLVGDDVSFVETAY